MQIGNEIIKNANMTAEQANAYFDALGFETNFVTKPQEQIQRVPEYVTQTIVEDKGHTEDGKPITTTRTRTYQDGYYEGKGSVDAIAMSTGVDGKSEVPQIQSITKKAGGSSNNYSSSNSGGKSNKSGGGGKAKEANRADKKKNEDLEIDRYHVITEQLERLNAELEKISKAKDRAFGAKRLKLMDQEIAKQEQIIKKNKEYADLLASNRNKEKDQLANLGAQFDANGVITNYNELRKANQADYSQYNSKIDEFNSKSGEEQEALDNQYKQMQDADKNYYSGYEDFLSKTFAEAADKKAETFDKLLEDYESDQEEYEKVMQEIQDAQDAIFDGKLAKVDYVISVKLDVDDRDIKHLEFLLEQIEDKDFHAAEAIANVGIQTEKNLGKIETYKTGINDIVSLATDGSKGVDDLLSGDLTLGELQKGGLTQDALDKLEEYIDGLGDANEALREMRETAWVQVNDEFEQYLEKMDRGLEKIEHLKSVTQSYQNIVDIVGKKFLGVSNDLIDKMNKSVVSQSQDLLKANKAKMEALQASYDQLKNEDTSGWSDQAKKERNELLNSMEDELQSAKESFMSSWEEALQAAADRWGQAVDKIIEEMEDKLAGMYGSLSELQEAYDRASDLDDQYLEDYDQIYELSKLTRDINNSIDDTDNIAAKEQYKELVEEINELEANGTKLSEYDLSVLQKKFELRQAQMALEEAQNAKSSVGMVRGEDGNYSYVYTANDEDVANAEQNYEDKLHEMQQLNGDYINSLQEQIIQTQADCAAALAEIKESDFNSYEEWREAVDRTQAYYDKKMDFYYSQLDGALSNNKELYENDWKNYSDLTGYKISKDEDYVDKFEETNYSILTGFQTMEQAHQAWNDATSDMLNDMSAAYITWQADVEDTMATAGTSVEEFADTMESSTDQNVQDSEKAADAVVEMGNEMKETFSDTLDAIIQWESEYGSQIDAAIAKNQELIESYNEMKRVMAEGVGDGSSDSGSSGSDSSGDDSGSGSGNGGSGDGSGSGKAPHADMVDLVYGMGQGKYGNGSTRVKQVEAQHPGSYASAQSILNQAIAKDEYNYRHNSSAWKKTVDSLVSAAGFDTGGYTGDWGDKSGRLALLHSKELVLNKDDTSNFLEAISMVREMSDVIEMNAKYASRMYDELSSPGRGASGSGDIIQQIEINADFPDATDHSEIETAFNNLINTASQYVNRVR